MENNPNGTAMSEDEHLKMELVADIKHEYIDGQIYAMPGASNNHSRIAANMLREIGNHLKGKPCEAFMADTKVKVGKDNSTRMLLSTAAPRPGPITLHRCQ